MRTKQLESPMERMPLGQTIKRPRRGRWFRRLHPWLYLSAGCWGVLLNWFVTIFCLRQLHWPTQLAFGCGLLLNSIFNFWFTRTIQIQRSRQGTQPEFSYASFILISALLLAVGSTLLWLLRGHWALPLSLTFVIVMMSISFLSLFAGRIWIFVSPDSAAIAYQGLEGEFYEDSTDSAKVGGFRAWYHCARYAQIRREALRCYQPDMTIYDLGCGGSQWNKDGLPVIGIDVNESMLRHGKEHGQLRSYHVRPLERTGLPACSADLVILTEVLEHIERPSVILEEVRRLLKPQGRLIISVPWDHVFSPFFWLFNANCFWRGYILDEEYYRQRCGHVHHFTRFRLRRLLDRYGFVPQELYLLNHLLIYGVCFRTEEDPEFS